MQSQTASKQDCTVGVMPTPIKWRVKEVEVVNHLSLLVTFNDGTQGKVTIVPQWLTGVFAELLQPETFKTVFVEYGAVTWENGLDLDPKSMYDAIAAHGHYNIQ